MKIGVDMDSVLADIMPGLNDFHNETYKTNFSLDQYTSYGLSLIWGGTPEEVVEKILDYYQSPYFLKAAPLKGAQEGVDTLSKKHDLVLITSRPYSIEPISKKWLDKYFPKKFKKVVHTNQVLINHHKTKKKSEICLDHDIEIMIDDHLDFAFDCALVCKKVLLFNQTWNQQKKLPHNIIRVNSWLEILKYL